MVLWTIGAGPSLSWGRRVPCRVFIAHGQAAAWLCPVQTFGRECLAGGTMCFQTRSPELRVSAQRQAEWICGRV